MRGIMQYSVVMNCNGLGDGIWKRVKTCLLLNYFTPKATGIYEKRFQNKEERDTCYFGMLNWLKTKGISDVQIERFPVEEL